MLNRFQKIKILFLFSLLIFISPVDIIHSQSTAEYEAKLREEEARLQSEVEALSKDVTNLQGQKQTIEQAIALIDAQIKEAQARIRLKTVSIEGLTKDINIKSSSISDLSQKLERSQDALANIIRRTNENDNISIIESMLSDKALSEFFTEVDSFQSVKRSLNTMMDDVRSIKDETQEEKEVLEDRKAKEADAKAVIEAEKRIIDKKKAEQAELLSIKNGQLKTYQQWVSERQNRISQIRSALFELRGSDGIPFGDAVDYAMEASKATGVRPAFILAILKQESNLGVNVGQCLLTNPTTGAGIGKNTGTVFKNVMKADRDVQPFLKITKNLGRDPYSTPVSCPIAGVGGYGGAMGPSQFIASTWVMYEKQLAKILNVPTADPWVPHHAITATAVFLKDLGAARGGFSAEQEAAARYYAGGGWKTRGMGYAASVLALANGFQEQINFITSN